MTDRKPILSMTIDEIHAELMAYEGQLVSDATVQRMLLLEYRLGELTSTMLREDRQKQYLLAIVEVERNAILARTPDEPWPGKRIMRQYGLLMTEADKVIDIAKGRVQA